MTFPRKLISICAAGTFILIFSGCASTNNNSTNSPKDSFAQWANSPSCNCRIVIGTEFHEEFMQSEIADRYNAPVFAGTSEGLLIDTIAEGFSYTLGSTVPKTEGNVRELVRMLGIINATKKHWDIFIMADASHFLSLTLRAMPDNGLSMANGTIHLVGWHNSTKIENAVHKISNGRFNVVYE